MNETLFCSYWRRGWSDRTDEAAADIIPKPRSEHRRVWSSGETLKLWLGPRNVADKSSAKTAEVLLLCLPFSRGLMSPFSRGLMSLIKFQGSSWLTMLNLPFSLSGWSSSCSVACTLPPPRRRRAVRSSSSVPCVHRRVIHAMHGALWGEIIWDSPIQFCNNTGTMYLVSRRKEAGTNIIKAETSQPNTHTSFLLTRSMLSAGVGRREKNWSKQHLQNEHKTKELGIQINVHYM